MALTDKLSAIGDAIREKTGKEDLLTLDSMVTEIGNISGGEEYNWSSIYELFHDYCSKNGFTEIELTVTDNGVNNLTIEHNLNNIPEMVILYPKNLAFSDYGYQLGIALTLTDNGANRTYCNILVEYNAGMKLLGVLTALGQTTFKFLVSSSENNVVLRNIPGNKNACIMPGAYILAVK